MPAADVIDLLSSEDEYDEPRKTTLASFAPRKDKAISLGNRDSNSRTRTSYTFGAGNHRDGWTSTAAGDEPQTKGTATYNGESVERTDSMLQHSHGIYAGNGRPKGILGLFANETNGRYGRTGIEEPSLQDLLAGVASNDPKRIEKYRLSLGAKDFQSPAAGYSSTSGFEKNNRLREAAPAGPPRRRSFGVALQQKASSRASDGNSIRPFKPQSPRPALVQARKVLKQVTSNVSNDSASNSERTAKPTPLESDPRLSTMKAPLSFGQDAVQMAQKRPLDTAASRVAFISNNKRQKLDDALPWTKLATEPAEAETPYESDDMSEATERISYLDEPKPPDSTTGVESAVTADDRVAHTSSNAAPRTIRKAMDDRTVVMEEILPRTLSNKAASQHPASIEATAQDILPAQKSTTPHGQPYTDDDRRLLQRLKEVDRLTWDDIMAYFPGRTRGSVQVYYSTRVRGKQIGSTPKRVGRPNRDPDEAAVLASARPKSKGTPPPPIAAVRSRRARGAGPAAVDGMVSWASLRRTKDHAADVDLESIGDDGANDNPEDKIGLTQDCVHPSSLPRILRLREAGLTGLRAWGHHSSAAPEELQNHVFRGYELQQQYHGTSGDVVALSWAPNDNRFVAGSIAISDSTSMQYNMSSNLLVGDADSGELKELADHHVPRPVIDDPHNVNGLHAMRQSQDPRLFLTVTAADFSSKGDKLFTAGTDKMLRVYAANKTLHRVNCRYGIPHTASVDLMAVRASGTVATGCHSPTGSINLYNCSKKKYTHELSLGPSRRNLTVSVAIFPSALKWGIAPRHQNLLLAGFSGDEEKANAGETCLWDVAKEQRIELRGSATRNVFDVAWNPNPSSASHAFAVASLSTGYSVSKGTRSIVSLFNLQDRDATRKRFLECQAGDLNDVVFCPHDDQLVAAGSTDGTVYVWDLRSKSSDPLHVLRHGTTENVLDHNRPRELTDTGVRFLSWGPTGSRLYSGASDGIVKVWNPYRSASNTFVEDIAPPMNQRSAVMSGMFSSDKRQLLVGTENGRIDLFSIGARGSAQPKRFKLSPVPPPEDGGPFEAAQELLQAGRIDIRRCGAMPFKQAVQGPNYNGPYLNPTADEQLQAQMAYDAALNAQHEISMKRVIEGINDIEDEAGSKAKKAVSEAQQKMDDLQGRLELFTLNAPKATAFQQSLRAAEHERRTFESQCAQAEPCNLDCGVLRTTDGIDDSDRSKLRIPGSLRSLRIDAAHDRCFQEPDKSCAECFPTNVLARNGVKRFCLPCGAKKAGLISRCDKCAQPTRTQTDEAKDNLCEHCSFSCFRCGQQASCNSSDSGIFDLVECKSCDLVWQAGSLGYELKYASTLHPERHRSDGLMDETLDAWDGFAQQEREHYASLWEAQAEDECM